VQLAVIEGLDSSHDGEAKAALDKIAGRAVELFKLGEDGDRYGRVVAVAAMQPRADIARSAQWGLLAPGLARNSATDAGCAAAFLSVERMARTAGLGLGADLSYVMRRAERTQRGSRSAKAAAPSMSISGAAGRRISPSRCGSAANAYFRPRPAT
jgi:hypothetical protein